MKLFPMSMKTGLIHIALSPVCGMRFMILTVLRGVVSFAKIGSETALYGQHSISEKGSIMIGESGVQFLRMKSVEFISRFPKATEFSK